MWGGPPGGGGGVDEEEVMKTLMYLEYEYVPNFYIMITNNLLLNLIFQLLVMYSLGAIVMMDN